MRKCRCPDSIAQEFTYGFAIIRIVAWMILTLSLGYIGYLYASFSNSERKEFKKAFIIAFNKKIN
jgi:cbb3-type cytochrome oxidase subunit 3